MADIYDRNIHNDPQLQDQGMTSQFSTGSIQEEIIKIQMSMYQNIAVTVANKLPQLPTFATTYWQVSTSAMEA